jgi:hypothetical protein
MMPVGRWIAWLLFGSPREEAVGGAPQARSRRRAPRLQTVAAWSVLIAGLAAIVAVANGRFGTEDLRVLGTSLGFAVFSSTAAAGAALRREGTGRSPWVGVATIVLSGLSLLMLEVAIWALDEDALRLFGSLALLTLAASHASIVLRAQRPDDGPLLRFSTAASILFATADCAGAAVVLQGNFDIPDPSAYIRATAVVLIAMLVTTAIPPLLRASRRRANRAPRIPPPPPPPTALPTADTMRVSPLAAAALAGVTALVGFLVGQATAQPDRQALATPTPAYTAPPPVYTPPPAPRVR